MRVKVRFNAEACQAPIIIDVRFLPRVGERLHIGFRKIIEVLEVYRLDNDNRYNGIVRGKYIQVENPPSPGLQRPPQVYQPLPAFKPPPPPPAPVPVAAPIMAAPAMAMAGATSTQSSSADYGNLSFDELATALKQAIPSPEPNL